jgi:hypothetical protein
MAESGACTMNNDIEINVGSIISDPHTVFMDAVQHSSWGEEVGARLPARGEWSTYRYATKDIVLGTVTHRDDRTRRRLTVRSYFVGEHPMFEEFEPTKALLIILMCQCYMSNGTVELRFENRVPFDIRELIERHLNVVVNGHEKSLPPELCQRLFPALAGLPKWAIDALHADPRVAPEVPCFYAYRGVWAKDHLLSILRRKIPLTWLYVSKPRLIGESLRYLCLTKQLKEVILEQYVLERLRDRQLGATWGNRILRDSSADDDTYSCSESILIDDGMCKVQLDSGQPFCLTIQNHSESKQTPIVPIRCYALGSEPRDFPDGNYCVAGVTDADLESEVELKLAIAAEESDEDEVDRSNSDRFTD